MLSDVSLVVGGIACLDGEIILVPLSSLRVGGELLRCVKAVLTRGAGHAL